MIRLLVPLLMLTEGIVFGVIAWMMYRKQSLKLELWQRTSGEVVEVKEHRRGGSEGGPTRHPVVRFTALSGETVTFESKFGSSRWKVKPGDRLEVLFDRNNPSDAELVGFLPQWTVPLVFGIISIGSLIGAPVVYFALKP